MKLIFVNNGILVIQFFSPPPVYVYMITAVWGEGVILNYRALLWVWSWPVLLYSMGSYWMLHPLISGVQLLPIINKNVKKFGLKQKWVILHFYILIPLLALKVSVFSSQLPILKQAAKLLGFCLHDWSIILLGTWLLNCKCFGLIVAVFGVVFFPPLLA
jgi:hypothetical protein